MAERLIRTLAFVDVAPAGSAILPHGINVAGTATKPDFVALDASGFTVVADTINCTVTNTGDAIASVNVWLELKHSIPRELGALPLSPSPFVPATGAGGGAGPLPTDGGEAGLVGAGTALDPLIPVAGPFRPNGSVFVMDDYLVPYGPLTAGVPSVLGVGNTSIFKSAGVSTQFSVNLAAGSLGPGQGSMMGVMDLQLIGAAAGAFISATQFRVGNDSGEAFSLANLEGTYDLFYAARVSFEGTNNFETGQRAFAGFREEIDLSVIGTREGAWFHPKDNGSQVNWFAFYRISDDSGIVTADIDTGVRVGFTAAHPSDGRAAQDLLVRFQGPAATAQLTMYIDGVQVVAPVALVNPVSSFTPMESLASVAAAQSNTMYVDWALWAINPGRVL